MPAGNRLGFRRSGRIIHFVGSVVLLTLISPGVSGYWPSRFPRPGGESPAPDDSIPPDPVSSFAEAPLNPPAEERVYLGTIARNFYDSAQDRGLSPRLIESLLKIFTGEIDFHHDFRKGDRFEILVASAPPRPGSAPEPLILAAKIETQKTSHWAFYYSDGKNPAGYYNENGNALAGFRLLCPLQHPRISSGYAQRRYHPILKYYRPHLAVDYAAPAGTPIRASAGGIIEYAGWKNGWGHYLSLRHNSTYTTTYGHLSRYAPNVKKGVPVRQGQIIGYVGSSGLATHPHLCYRLLQNGKSINPLTFPGLVSPPVSNPQQFQAAKAELIAKLQSLSRSELSTALFINPAPNPF